MLRKLLPPFSLSYWVLLIFAFIAAGEMAIQTFVPENQVLEATIVTGFGIAWLIATGRRWYYRRRVLSAWWLISLTLLGWAVVIYRSPWAAILSFVAWAMIDVSTILKP